MDAQDGAGDASMLLVVAQPTGSGLLPLPACDGAPPLPPLLRREGVLAELDDAMAGRADRHAKTQTCDPHDTHAA